MQENIKPRLKKTSLAAIVSFSVFLASAICYLAVSFATKSWDKSWLILAGGFTLAFMVFTVFVIRLFSKKQSYLLPRIFLALSIVYVFILAYLAITTLLNIDKCWILFLIMAIAVTGADTVFAFWTNAKTRNISLIIFIQVSSVLEYVVLCLVGLLKWNIYWFIPLIGLVINGIILFFLIKNKIKEKKKL